MNTRTTHTMLFALLLAGCGGAMNPGGGEDPGAAFSNDDVPDGAPADRSVAPRETPDADAGEVCGDPDNPGRTLTRACMTACGAGTETCVDYRWTGCTARQPMTEMCNRVDDNCDGQVDEGCGDGCTPGAMRPCYNGPLGTSGVGACRAGMQVCGDDRAWSPVCVGSVTPAAEQCNGADDDCDGRSDEDLSRSCNSACGAGTETCSGGRWAGCSARTPATERCNGVDDDCDGRVDEDFNVGASCSSGSGTCRRDGQYVCAADGSGTRCNALAAPPAPETCNGTDDDCDGAVDEGLARACSNACGAGTEVCVGGRWTGCSARQPTAEVCDHRDNNCDGRIDEGLTAAYTFNNRCSRSPVFVAFNCNACRGLCTGYWVQPGRSLTFQFQQNTCYNFSVLARTPRGDACLTNKWPSNRYVGEMHEYCNGDCDPDSEDEYCNGWE